ncbi:MAG: hypothetical protein AAF385_04805 [Pseudomonadota bacterium]
MSSIVPVIIRLTGNVTMFLGALIAGLAGYDYWRGPGAGENGTLAGVVIGVLVFLVGWRTFRKWARDMDAQMKSESDSFTDG